MKNGKNPDPNSVHPIEGNDKEIYVKQTINSPDLLAETDADDFNEDIHDPCLRFQK